MRVLVTGASGFIGSAVARRLRDHPGVDLRTTRHAQALPGAVPLDLTDPASVARAVAGVDVVVHAAHAIGGDPVHLRRVNVTGTAMLLDACAATTRVVAVSTASVYGPGPWRDQPLTERPASPTSASRAAADRLVLARGDVVVRPHLVHGTGDRWFLPRAVQITRALGRFVAPQTRHSAIHVETLAAVLADLALTAHGTGIVLASEPATSLRPLVAAALTTPVDGEISHEEALAHPAGRSDARWAHDVGLLGLDHDLGVRSG